MTQHDSFIHKIYRQARPAIQRLGLSAIVRRFVSASTRQAIAKRIGLAGYAQSTLPTTALNKRPSRKFAFVFICQSGEIEVEAALLAISLKRFLRCDYELIAVVPTPAETWGTPNAATLELLQSLNVKIQPVINPIGPSFPHGNKLPCFKIQTDADKLFYLDSDILLIRDFYDEARFDLQLSAKPTDVKRSVDTRLDWPEIYNTVGLQPPTLRRPTTVSKYFGFPQFNGGVICVNTTIKLGDTWEHYINLVRSDDRFTPDRLWSDQIGLALAIQKLGVEVDYLDERYNYPLHHKRLHSGISPYFVHYHYPILIAQEPKLLKLFQEFVDQYPQLAKIIEGKPEWEALLARKPVSSSTTKKSSRLNREPVFPELIITGIPQSGTSDLCHLLQSYSNCIIINEPEDLQTHLLSDTAIPWGVGLYYLETRDKIMAAKPIMNGQSSEAMPRIDNEHFILGTHNAVGILSHLPRLRRVMPEARVIICVRNPFTTIATWKQTPSQYNNADLPLISLGCPDDPWLTAKNRAMLENIIAETHLPQKRAMLWHYFGELVLNEAPNVSIIRYEDLIANPKSVTDSILKGYDKGSLRQGMSSPETHNEATALDTEDIRAIRAICSQTAAELGIDMRAV